MLPPVLGNRGAGVGRKNNTHHSPPERADLGAELVLIQAKLWQREACAVIRPEPTSGRLVPVRAKRLRRPSLRRMGIQLLISDPLPIYR